MWWAHSNFFHSCLSLAEYFSTYNDRLDLVIFALMCFGMTRSCTCSMFPPFYLAFSPQLALHINREQITQCLDRNISYLILSFFSNFLLGRQFLLLPSPSSFQLHLSRSRNVFVQVANSICPTKWNMDFDISFFFPRLQFFCSFTDICPNQEMLSVFRPIFVQIANHIISCICLN